jgi:hypothetical protein
VTGFDVHDEGALRRSRVKWVARRDGAKTALKQAVRMIRRRDHQLRTLTGKVPGASGGWHAKATRIPYAGAGSFVAAGKKIVWHTTEGAGLPSYSGSAPHFTFDPRTGKLWQHIPISQAAKSLVHPSQVETNRAGAIQVELIGRASQTPSWSDADYARIAELARWIEKYAGVPRKATVKFSATPKRMAASTWLKYAGHCGHQHVPGNQHWDPGALKIEKIL